MTDASLKELAQLKNLATLILRCPDATDMGLEQVAACERLTSFKLIGIYDLNDEQRLAALQHFTSLSLVHTGWGDEGPFSQLVEHSFSK